MSLDVQDLTVAFGERTVAHVPELTVRPGHIVGLAGESGSGKSMTATAVLGLAERLGATVTGSITLDGDELVGAPEARLRAIRGRRIAMIFQSPSASFHPVLRVGEVFRRALRLHGERSKKAARRRAEEALAEVLLPAAVLDRYPHQMSGGQLQRVAIALALALRAEVLVADEPTTALDVTVQAEILTLMRRLCETDELAVLMISHDLAALAEVADHLVVMRDGEVVESGPGRSVIDEPHTSYTRELIAAVPVLEDTDA
ncbi:MAG: ATP-binding cassette domain-containing protein [Streptosporangiales bacterium]|nr:ATP-binding cassette domain-containing protein [Streptosporangiales bacterium]